MYPADQTSCEMSNFPIEGNVIDHTWPFIVVKENGKPDHIAITLLAHIVYWYRPVYHHNPDGSIILGKKYKADILQRSYSEIEDMLGLTKREAQEAFQRLEVLGFVTRELRTIDANGQKISNVLFLRLNHQLLAQRRDEYLKKCISSYAKKDEGIRQKGQGGTPNVTTYTENTTQTTQKEQQTVKAVPVVSAVPSEVFVDSFPSEVPIDEPKEIDPITEKKAKACNWFVNIGCDIKTAIYFTETYTLEDIQKASLYVEQQLQKKKAKNETIGNIVAYLRKTLEGKWWLKK
jgi:hypothetical protein